MDALLFYPSVTSPGYTANHNVAQAPCSFLRGWSLSRAFPTPLLPTLLQSITSRANVSPLLLVQRSSFLFRFRRSVQFLQSETYKNYIQLLFTVLSPPPLFAFLAPLGRLDFNGGKCDRP